MKQWISTAPRRSRQRRQRGRLSNTGLFLLLLWIVLIIGGAGAWRRMRTFWAERQTPAEISAGLPAAPPKPAETPNILPALSADRTLTAPNVYSPYLLLIRLEDGTALLEKESETAVYPASLTKIMTALAAIEALPDLEREFTLSESIFQEIWKANASTVGYQPEETVRAIDLLYGVMLPSGADASLGLAEGIDGSETALVERMNRRASQLGMDGTHFTNACGLQDKKHKTTLKDLSLLLREALKNETFRELFTSSRHSTPGTNLHPDGITVRSTLFEKLSDPKVPDGEILGGKTGFTDEAGLCLASLAEINGKEYVLLTAGAPGNNKGEPLHILDAQAVYGWLGELKI